MQNLSMDYYSSSQWKLAKLHGYGYVYQYRKDTNMRIQQFSKKPDTWICLLFKK